MPRDNTFSRELPQRRYSSVSSVRDDTNNMVIGLVAPDGLVEYRKLHVTCARRLRDALNDVIATHDKREAEQKKSRSGPT